MEIWIVIVIVFAAAVYLGRVFYKGVKLKGGCSGGCNCCDAGSAPSGSPAAKARDDKP